MPPSAAPLTIIAFARAEDSRGGATESARIVRSLNERGFDVTLTIRGVDASVIVPVRQTLSTLARREVTVLPPTEDRAALAADLHAADLLVMPGQTGRFGLLGLEAVMLGVPVLVPADSGIGMYLADREQFPPELRPPLVLESFRAPVPVDRWVEQVSAMLADWPAAQARALRLQQHLVQRNKSWEGAAASLAAIARYTDAVENLITGRSPQPDAATAPAESPRDRGLYYEAAVDILGSLMSAASAVEWLAEHGGPADLRTPAVPVRLRREYLSDLGELDPADPATVTETIRVRGAQLAALGAAPTVVPRDDPDRFRLARGDHQWVFSNKIVPELYGNLTAAAVPTAVIVSGPPGSGKTTVIRRLCSERPRAVVIDPELLFAYHPRAWDLTLADDPRAGDVVMWDALGWTTLAAEHVSRARADILLELTSDRDTEEFAALLGDQGYRVEVQVMAVPPALATLHATLRFHCRHGNWRALAE
ncbi:hypothetical protein NRB56_05490 [Nocardia sp. RB56]|uniref:UDP-N-acetylglucosamine kinase n=1 Tax=Nocardia aurantia TaxID=2585199 RepID=A0A7K0DGR8_9NOCA|nr:zeta toxin family protein [Nocardia aurantia]MQY24995.1 hypothetical protein [Nocardia aurantia]